jgi:outer membrane protein, multidrug efflux system
MSTIKRSLRLVSLISLVSSLASCAVGPDYETPTLALARDEVATPEDKALLDTWWLSFEDPILSRLVDRLADENLQIAAANARVDAARASRRGATAGLLPSLTANFSNPEFRQSPNFPGPIGPLAEAGLAPLGAEVFDAGFDASWEIDVFGGQRRQTQRADAQLDVTRATSDDTKLRVIAELARNYIELRSLEAQRAIVQQSIAIQRATLNIAESRQRAGLASTLDANRARADLLATEAQIPQFAIAERGGVAAIAVLLGTTVANIEQDLRSNSESTEEGLARLSSVEVPVGLSSELLTRRRDIAIADAQLAARSAELGIAAASLYPRFLLTGSRDQQSGSFSQLFNASSRAWTLGPSIQWPIFAGGAVRANRDAARAQLVAAEAEYRLAVLTAVADVEVRLVGYAQSQIRAQALDAAAQDLEDNVALAKRLYDLGLEDFQVLLDTQRTQLAIDSQRVISKADALLQTVALFKALGGGWESL